MPEVLVLRSFPFSRDGVIAEQAVAGALVNVPEALVAGLVSEGFVQAPLANKMLTVAPETAAEILFDGMGAAESVAPTIDVEAIFADEEDEDPGVIPADWQSLQWKRRVKLAEEISGLTITGENPGDQANAIIAAELARRDA